MRDLSKRWAAAWLGVALLAMAAGCATLEELAPPPGPDLLGSVDNSPEVVRGRELYVTKCGLCHSVQAVDRYSDRLWLETLPRMGREAELSEADTAAITAYVMATRRHQKAMVVD